MVSWQACTQPGVMSSRLSMRGFSAPPGGGGPPGGDGEKDEGMYVSDDESADKFDSDRRFSNFVLFAGSLSLFMIFMASSVKQSQKSKKTDVEKQKELANKGTTYSGKANIGGPWLLYDTKGEPVSHKAFAGKYYLIYFGFTYCPDVCPVSLMKMAASLKNVRESKEYNYFDMEAIFVSVDPDRDTNERIDEYTKIFHEDLIGLTHKTNDHVELKELLKKFKIHVSKIYLSEEEEQEDLDTLRENAPKVADMVAEQQAKAKKE